MAVLPPVSVPCVEPLHTLTVAANEPLHTLTNISTEVLNSFDPCEDIVLSITGVTAANISLAWILYNSIVTPQSYNLYRKKIGTDYVFQLYATNIQANTYVDNGVSTSSTYDYYVTAVYPVYGEATEFPSNIVEATTPALAWVYTFRSAAMDIYNVANLASPSLQVTLTDSQHTGGGGNTWVQTSDPNYMWFSDGTGVFPFQTANNLLNPPRGTILGNIQSIIIRTGLSTRNNMMLCYNFGNQWFESYDITNPLSPVLIAHSAVAFFYCLNTMVYDAVNSRIIAGFTDTGTFTRPYFVGVNADGTFGSLATLGPNLDGAGLPAFEALLYGGFYWFGTRGNGLYAQKLDGTGPAGKQINFPWVFRRMPDRMRLRGKYLFVTSADISPSWQPIQIYDMTGPTLIYQLGTANTSATGMLTSGNTLIFSINNTLYTYDITALLASGAAPVLLGQVSGPASLNGITAYPSDGWESNNGGCAT